MIAVQVFSAWLWKAVWDPDNSEARRISIYGVPRL